MLCITFVISTQTKVYISVFQEYLNISKISNL